MKKRTKIIIGASAASLVGAAITAGYIMSIKKAPAVISKGFTVTAHTGCEGAEDNSIEAIVKGAEAGADIVEFDLNFNEKGEPVLAHDGAEEDSVTLKAAFDTVAMYENLRVNVDCKSVVNLKTVIETAELCGVKDRIFYTGIEKDDVEAVKNNTPEITYYLNRDIDKLKKSDEAYIRSLIDEIKNLGAVGININYGGASKEMVKIFHDEGLLVSVWTVNDKIAMYKVLALGCDNITTRKPSKLIEIINNKSK